MRNVQIFAHVCNMSKKVIIHEEVAVKNIDAERLGKNPFIESLSIPVNKVTMKGQFRATKEIAVDGRPIVVPVEVEIESESYCKVFNDAKRRKVMVNISKPGKELFLWLIYELESGKDYVWLNKTRYLRENGIKSLNTYRAAVRDLILNGFMVQTVATDVYWINPALFFTGSRLRNFPQNVVRK